MITLNTIKDKYNVIFAFNKAQFEEAATPKTRYTNLGSGILCPTPNVKKFLQAVDTLGSDTIKAKKATFSQKTIIWDQLVNHEVQITGDLTDTIEALDGYGYTKQEIKTVYNEYFTYCVDNDLF